MRGILDTHCSEKWNINGRSGIIESHLQTWLKGWHTLSKSLAYQHSLITLLVKLPRAWDRGRRETENCQRVRSWTVLNEMRGVLGRVFASAAGRILDSANPREIGA